jgi:hypothetical protein
VPLTAVAQNSMGDVHNDRGIVTQGQTGNNYLIVLAKPPAIEIIDTSSSKNDDGTSTIHLRFRIVSRACLQLGIPKSVIE